MTKTKKVESTEVLKVGSTYKLVKVWKKEGKSSRIGVGLRTIKICEIPTIGNCIKGKYDSEYPNGTPKEVKFIASRTIVGLKDIPGVGLRIETTTSIYLLLY